MYASNIVQEPLAERVLYTKIPVLSPLAPSQKSRRHNRS